MPNIQKILNEEIRRLARREIRNELVNPACVDAKNHYGTKPQNQGVGGRGSRACEAGAVTRKSFDCSKAGTCYGRSDQKAANGALPFPKEICHFAGRQP